MTAVELLTSHRRIHSMSESEIRARLEQALSGDGKKPDETEGKQVLISEAAEGRLGTCGAVVTIAQRLV